MSVTAPTTRQGGRDGFVNSRPFEWLSRAGFVARGLIYGIIGLLALKLAIGSGGKTTDQQGAMRTLAQQPLGRTMLVGARDRPRRVCDVAVHPCGARARARGLRRGLRPGGGARQRTRLRRVLRARGRDRARRHGGKTGSPKATTAGVLSWPAGPLLVGLAGLVFIGVAVYQAYRGVPGTFLHDSKTEEMRPEVKHWVARIGTVGHLARAVVFGLVGAFLIKAAVQYNARKARSDSTAPSPRCSTRRTGISCSGSSPCGLLSFALYSISDARYRRI